MSRATKMILGTLLVLVLALSGYGYYRYQRRQHILWAQLLQLDDTLAMQNGLAQQAGRQEVKSQQAQTEKNHSHPQDLAVLQVSEEILVRTQTVLAGLADIRQKLLSAPYGGYYPLKQPAETSPAARLLGPGTRQGAQLATLLSAYASYIRRLYLADSLPRSHDTQAATIPPAAGQWLARYPFDDTPRAAALASLTQIESEILTYQAAALAAQHRQLGTGNIFTNRTIVLATAVADRVAPGATYSALLTLAHSLYRPGLAMSCNGQSVTVGTDGIGRVRFVVPARPVALHDTVTAFWVGKITFRTYDQRDTTFQVRVPYRIVSR